MKLNLITFHKILILFLTTSLIFTNDFRNWDESIEQTEKEIFKVDNFADDFNIPWGMAFLPDSNLLVSDKVGDLWLIDYHKKTKNKIHSIPKVKDRGQGGLLDVQIHPDFINNNYVYIGYTDYIKNKQNRTFTSIIRGKLEKYNLTNQKVIYKATDNFYDTKRVHYGTRIVFDKDNYLYFSIGDRGKRDQAQLLNFPNGKIHRLYDDGTIPEDNPFFNTSNAIKSIWTYGNRNPQGLAIHPATLVLYETEHGPKGGDELNILQSGKNYGWPEITYGKNYSGTTITKFTHKDGMEQPILHWTPSIAVCGIDFYDKKLFKSWENNLLVTSLKFEKLYRYEINSNKIINQEMIYNPGSRIRDVETGPDGYIYLALEDPGRIIRLVPIKN